MTIVEYFQGLLMGHRLSSIAYNMSLGMSNKERFFLLHFLDLICLKDFANLQKYECIPFHPGNHYSKVSSFMYPLTLRPFFDSYILQ